jgi:RNA polymerase subunit RPABC4/transcription elongation factor Spt4
MKTNVCDKCGQEYEASHKGCPVCYFNSLQIFGLDPESDDTSTCDSCGTHYPSTMKKCPVCYPALNKLSLLVIIVFVLTLFFMIGFVMHKDYVKSKAKRQAQKVSRIIPLSDDPLNMILSADRLSDPV